MTNFEHGPITREQHNAIVNLDENYVRRVGYCWRVYWVPGHGIHPAICW